MNVNHKLQMSKAHGSHPATVAYAANSPHLNLYFPLHVPLYINSPFPIYFTYK